MWASRRGREDTASAAGHRAAGPSGSRGGCWSCPCLQPLQPPCLHQHSLPIPALKGAGLCLAPCKDGGQSILSSPCSRAGFEVTHCYPSHSCSSRPWGVSLSSLSTPAAEAEHIPILWGSYIPTPDQPPFSGARSQLKPTQGSVAPALNLGIAEQGPGWGKAQCQRSGRGKGMVTWKQPDNSHQLQWEKAGELMPIPVLAEQGHGHTTTPSFNMV